MLSRFLFKNLFKLPGIVKFRSKLALGVLLILFFSGYKPTLDLPPVKQSIVQAQILPTQIIDAKSLTFEFNLPHPGYLSTKYSSYHPGVDIATGLGMPIHPIAPGKVIDAGYNFWGLGLVATIEHREGYKSTYAHMGKIYVSKDQQVNTDSILGIVGLTGRTSGPHTHLELQKDNQYLDPLTLLPKIRDYPIEDDFKAITSEPKVSQKIDFKKELKNNL